MYTNRRKIAATAAAGLLGLLAVACSSRSVDGHTYQNGTGGVKLEFTSGNKAYIRVGPMTESCGYSQSSHNVVLSCSGDKIKLTIGDDGVLAGPPDGLFARWTKVRQ